MGSDNQSTVRLEKEIDRLHRRIGEMENCLAEGRQVEDLLRGSETRFESLIHTAPIVILFLTPDLQVLEFNAEAEKLFGRKRDEVIGQNYLELFIPENTRAAVVRDMKKVFAGTPTRDFEYEVTVSDGSLRLLSWYATHIMDADGDPVGIAIAGLDITEQKLKEKKLDEAEKTFQQLAENTDLVIWVFSLDENRGLYINPAWERFTGRPDMIFQWRDHWWNMVHPDDLTEFRRTHDLWVQDGLRKKFEIEYRMVLPDGKVRWVRDRTFPITVSEGRVLRLAGVLEDITRKKEAEEHLRMQARIIDQVHDSVIATDLDGNIIRWNAGSEKIFGYSEEEVLGKHISFVYPRDKQEFLQKEVIAPLMEKGEHDIISQAQRRSGERFYGHLSLSLLRDGDDNPVAMVGYMMDITELVEAEQQMKKTTELLRAEREELKEKNIALKQILNHMEQEKITFKNEICSGAENLMMPTIEKLRNNDGYLSDKDIEILEDNLKSFFGKEIDQFKNNYGKLTAREMDVCEGVRIGLSAKEIAEALSISGETVRKHRLAIRRKLQLKYKNINLAAYLRYNQPDET